MLGIENVASYIPERKIDNLEQADKFGADREFVEKKIGVLKLPRLSEDESVAYACVEAFKALSEKGGVELEEIDCLVVCTQNPDRDGLPHNSAILHAELGLKDECACFDIGLGCSGYVYGLSIIESFMQANGLKRGLFFTCDPYSRILDPEDKNTCLLFGDAATVTLISDSPKYVKAGAKFSTRGAGREALEKVDGKLAMNGRAVFNFALMDVPKQIKSLLESQELDVASIDLFLLHQGSRFMLENTIKRAGIPSDKAPIELSETGNTVSSSIPILLEKRIRDLPGLVLMSGFGVGLSWASAIYKQNS
ncbi:ketoacyl-ACP synthase III [Alloalcanivorax mobilis]|uniref:ketoacyl-ACP synthase III n=1 Tax=Alloalcanivorax mobilis TaxID=2019569 RepID=UPI000C776C73|nr:ketoacyl-ACP synthase III [Alloalcanivorax mobilis]